MVDTTEERLVFSEDFMNPIVIQHGCERKIIVQQEALQSVTKSERAFAVVFSRRTLTLSVFGSAA